MQTFMVPPRYLDDQRLGKQRVEARQIIGVLRGETAAWRNHPAVRMWDGHIGALAVYGTGICDQWLQRGHQDSLYGWFADCLDGEPGIDVDPPWWILDTAISDAVVVSHWANLMRKAPIHYGDAIEEAVLRGDATQNMADLAHPELPYLWPTPDKVVKLSTAESRRITDHQVRLMVERGWVLDEYTGEVTVEGFL